MKKALPVGIEFYKQLIEKPYYYVDKTLIIKEFLDGGRKGKPQFLMGFPLLHIHHYAAFFLIACDPIFENLLAAFSA